MRLSGLVFCILAQMCCSLEPLATTNRHAAILTCSNREDVPSLLNITGDFHTLSSDMVVRLLCLSQEDHQNRYFIPSSIQVWYTQDNTSRCAMKTDASGSYSLQVDVELYTDIVDNLIFTCPRPLPINSILSGTPPSSHLQTSTGTPPVSNSDSPPVVTTVSGKAADDESNRTDVNGSESPSITVTTSGNAQITEIVTEDSLTSAKISEKGPSTTSNYTATTRHFITDVPYSSTTVPPNDTVTDNPMGTPLSTLIEMITGLVATESSIHTSESSSAMGYVHTWTTVVTEHNSASTPMNSISSSVTVPDNSSTRDKRGKFGRTWQLSRKVLSTDANTEESSGTDIPHAKETSDATSRLLEPIPALPASKERSNSVHTKSLDVENAARILTSLQTGFGTMLSMAPTCIGAFFLTAQLAILGHLIINYFCV